jgi:hypothetical protein
MTRSMPFLRLPSGILFGAVKEEHDQQKTYQEKFIIKPFIFRPFLFAAQQYTRSKA